jgi:hypothetical protein
MVYLPGTNGQLIPFQYVLDDGQEATGEQTLSMSRSYRDYLDRTNYHEL